MKFSKPNQKVKKVIIYNPGYYPKPIRPIKDLTLPMRLWPNAEIHMIGNFDQTNKRHHKNIDWFTENISSNIKYWTDLDQSLNSEDNLLFIHHNTYNAFGGIAHPSLLEQYKLTISFKGQVVVFYNDELLTDYDDFVDWLNGRATNQNFKEKNKELIEEANKIEQKQDWSNVAIMANQNLVADWANDHVSSDLIHKGLNIIYLSDHLLYDINTNAIKPSKTDKSGLGIYIALLTGPRITVCNKLFAGQNDLTLKFSGSKSNELDPSIAGDGQFIENKRLGSVLAQYDWSIYIGKGKWSKYLGATFYEPLLAGIPVFVWTKTDPNKKIFGQLDCYFSSWQELKKLTEQDLANLHQQQIKKLGYESK